MEANRTFASDQSLQVHPDLPSILKEYTKAVIKENPATAEDIISFSAGYFGDKAKSEGKTAENVDGTE